MSNILVAGAYRSGSNHIAESLSRVFGTKRSILCNAREGWATDPQRLSAPICDTLFNRVDGMVYLQHIMASPHNVGLINVFKPSVIVCMRKLIPSLHSLRKYGDAMAEDNRLHSVPFIEHWNKLDNEGKWAWVAYNTIPWFYQFYVSWMRVTDFPIHFVWYEKHFADQEKSAADILKFLGVSGVPQELLIEPFEHKDANYTKNRKKLPVPDFVRDFSMAAIKGWGPWKDNIRRDLL